MMRGVLRCRKEPTTTVLQLAALVGTYDIKLASDELMWVSHEAPRMHTQTKTSHLFRVSLWVKPGDRKQRRGRERRENCFVKKNNNR